MAHGIAAPVAALPIRFEASDLARRRFGENREICAGLCAHGDVPIRASDRESTNQGVHWGISSGGVSLAN
jgi:hypothetical protein